MTLNTKYSLLWHNCLLILAYVQSTHGKILNKYSCDPTTDCANQSIGDLVPDPEDCHNYYLCIDSNGTPTPSDVSLPCPDGEAFDFESEQCVPETLPCINYCVNTYCNESCINEFDFVADPYNCSKYYICLSGVPEQLYCINDAPYFNGVNCTTNIHECCQVCTPFCETAYIETYDPYNCHNFYLCIQPGYPSEDYLFSCPEGEYFNFLIGKCDIEGTDDCEPICQLPTTVATTVTPDITDSTSTSDTSYF